MIDLIDGSDVKTLDTVLTYNSASEIETLLPVKDIQELDCSDEDAILVENCEGKTTQIVEESEDYFKINNLFSEIKTKYQQVLARRNLGLNDDFNLVWGNISGNLENQTDLITFVRELISIKTTSVQNALTSIINNLSLLLDNTVYYGENLNDLHAASDNIITTEDYSGYIYILSKNNNIEFEVNGLIGGFEASGTKTIDSETFYVFRSVYSNLGITKIIIRNGNV